MLPCRTPLRWIVETRRIDPSPSSIGEAPGQKDFAYSPSAIAASATGAEKPTVAESQPARKPTGAPKECVRKLYSPLDRGNMAASSA